MLAIRMQRTGRKGHAQFRVVVQDSRRTPTSGKIVASIGHYNPHTKEIVIDKEKAAFYVQHGAQPSDRVARLLKAEGVKLPDWVKLESKKQGQIRHGEKLRRNRPDEPIAEPVAEVPAEEPVAETAESTEVAAETSAEVETPTEGVTEEAPAEEVAAAEADADVPDEIPAEEPAAEPAEEVAAAEEAPEAKKPAAKTEKA